jgi:hypothetical protein
MAKMMDLEGDKLFATWMNWMYLGACLAMESGLAVSTVIASVRKLLRLSKLVRRQTSRVVLVEHQTQSMCFPAYCSTSALFPCRGTVSATTTHLSGQAAAAHPDDLRIQVVSVRPVPTCNAMHLSSHNGCLVSFLAYSTRPISISR